MYGVNIAYEEYHRHGLFDKEFCQRVGGAHSPLNEISCKFGRGGLTLRNMG